MTVAQRRTLIKRMAKHRRASIRAQAARMRGQRQDEVMLATAPEAAIDVGPPRANWRALQPRGSSDRARAVQDILESADTPQGTMVIGGEVVYPTGVRVRLVDLT